MRAMNQWCHRALSYSEHSSTPSTTGERIAAIFSGAALGERAFVFVNHGFLL